jgi:hypothetical protein
VVQHDVWVVGGTRPLQTGHLQRERPPERRARDRGDQEVGRDTDASGEEPTPALRDREQDHDRDRQDHGIDEESPVEGQEAPEHGRERGDPQHLQQRDVAASRRQDQKRRGYEDPGRNAGAPDVMNPVDLVLPSRGPTEEQTDPPEERDPEDQRGRRPPPR